MQRTSTAPLVIHKIGMAVVPQDVARLEVPVEKVMAVGAQQKFCQPAEIVFQRLFVEGDAGESQKIVLEIVQIPSDRLAVEARAWIAHLVVQIAAGFDLKAWQHGHHLAIRFDGLGSNFLVGPMFREKLKERRVPQVFFEIRAVAQIFRVNIRHRQSVPAKMPGKLKERDVLFAYVVQNSNGAELLTGQPDDFTPRTAELALKWLHPSDRRVEMLLEEFLENVHDYDFQRDGGRRVPNRHEDITE